MVPKTVWRVSRCCLWILMLLSAMPAAGQEDVRLRAVYRGSMLPEGTVVVALRQEATHRERGRYQPEFFATEDFPRDRARVLWRTAVGPDGRTRRAVPRTQASGDLYFLYARTPDSTLYWSYSMERGALKYDVVASGVMSVAPVDDPGTATRVRRTFFGEPSERVVVHMPDDPASGEPGPPDEVEAATTAEPDVRTASAEDSASAASGAAVVPGAAPEAGGGTPEPTANAARRWTPPAAAVPPPVSPGGITVPRPVFYGLLGLLVLLVGLATYLFHIYRAEQLAHRKTLFKLHARFTAADDPQRALDPVRRGA